ncbi:MAG: glycosyltransferase family 61 protein [Verrucomicrobiota bacterium JB023]|nr:glycosyltransferase family 61 protein [Verrucomicrobiota bacterium JB023]
MLPQRAIFDSPGLVIETVEDACPFPAPPRSPGSLPAPFLEHWPAQIPARYRFTLQEARVIGRNGQLADRDGYLLTSHAPELRPPRLPQLPPPRHLPGRSLLLASPSAWKNYSHWLLSSLPKLLHTDLSSIDQILCPLDRSFQRDSLNLILNALPAGPQHPLPRLIPLTADSHFRCEELVAYSTLPPSQLHPREIRDLRRLPLQPGGSSQRLFLSRATSWRRRILNEPELHSLLRHEGFDPMDCGQLDFASQASLFASATALIAPHGASLANLVWAARAPAVLELFPANFIRPNFCHLAALTGAPYRTLVAPNPPREPDFRIPPALLAEALREWLG